LSDISKHENVNQDSARRFWQTKLSRFRKKNTEDFEVFHSREVVLGGVLSIFHHQRHVLNKWPMSVFSEKNVNLTKFPNDYQIFNSFLFLTKILNDFATELIHYGNGKKFMRMVTRPAIAHESLFGTKLGHF
jgi:hypothetical protein